MGQGGGWRSGERESQPIDWSQESGGPKDIVFPQGGISPDGGIFPNIPSLLGQFILFSLHLLLELRHHADKAMHLLAPHARSFSACWPCLH